VITEPRAAKIFTVTELNAAVRDVLESTLASVWLEGEISNCRTYPSGHTYLTLKDENAQVSAVLFRGSAQAVKFKPEDGLKVVVFGRVSCYEKRGDLQVVIVTMEPREIGALQLAFNQLKEKLSKEGLFDEERKRPLPRYPQRVGVVTSLQGAAIRDILSVLGRRWNGLEIIICPVRVQGDGAAAEIAGALDALNALSPAPDVILAGRGGGSIEDLWAFNEEIVARALARSSAPIISCVGHETDFTIADFVADVRAPTPSAAAELCVPDQQAVLADLAGFEERLSMGLGQLVKRLSERLARAASHPLLQNPLRLYEEPTRRVDELTARLQSAINFNLERAQKSLKYEAGRLDMLSPLKVLSRGYAIAQIWPQGEIIKDAAQAKPGDWVRISLSRGHLDCEVKEEPS
jgi:exodeoxyribonuclease VII large subunit